AQRTALERYLAGLFCKSLGVAEVGIEESFFDLGGHSISAAILVNWVQEQLGEILHVVAIFDHPTVAGLAAYPEHHSPRAVARLWGGGEESEDRDAAPAVRID